MAGDDDGKVPGVIRVGCPPDSPRRRTEPKVEAPALPRSQPVGMFVKSEACSSTQSITVSIVLALDEPRLAPRFCAGPWNPRVQRCVEQLVRHRDPKDYVYILEVTDFKATAAAATQQRDAVKAQLAAIVHGAAFHQAAAKMTKRKLRAKVLRLVAARPSAAGHRRQRPPVAGNTHGGLEQRSSQMDLDDAVARDIGGGGVVTAFAGKQAPVDKRPKDHGSAKAVQERADDPWRREVDGDARDGEWWSDDSDEVGDFEDWEEDVDARLPQDHSDARDMRITDIGHRQDQDEALSRPPADDRSWGENPTDWRPPSQLPAFFVKDGLDDVERVLATTRRRMDREAIFQQPVQPVEVVERWPRQMTMVDEAVLTDERGRPQGASLTEDVKVLQERAIFAARTSNMAELEACQNEKAVVKYLLRRGADINAQNFKGNSSLHFAFGYRYEDLGNYLPRARTRSSRTRTATVPRVPEDGLTVVS
ncbi:hypothetical protein JL720_15802 [Aureococcus anophagefferens]|nr:hypothetical protein JL720_15802 [Aureococcus anophagefferens]